jgi:Ser/Thr protein kinase RdoA (MazF antagonist)
MARAIESFHRAVASVPCPPYLRERKLIYDRADRGAFGDLPTDVEPRVRPLLEELCALRRPLSGLRDQVIHGDANAANILIAPGLPPAIIDLAPYWRPPEFALAVSALWMCGYHQHVEAFPAFEHAREFDQLLLRALIRTLLVADGFRYTDRLDEYRPSIDIVRARLAR